MLPGFPILGALGWDFEAIGHWEKEKLCSDLSRETSPRSCCMLQGLGVVLRASCTYLLRTFTWKYIPRQEESFLPYAISRACDLGPSGLSMSAFFPLPRVDEVFTHPWVPITSSWDLLFPLLWTCLRVALFRSHIKCPLCSGPPFQSQSKAAPFQIPSEGI